MHGAINVKFPNNTSKWQMGFNSVVKGLSLASSSAPLKPIMNYGENENLFSCSHITVQQFY